jgi:hypothetical protein
LYGEGDVARLELARAAVTLGHPIRRVATLSDADLRSLIEASGAASARSGLRSDATERAVADVIDAIRQYDLTRAESSLNAAALLFTPTELVIDVLTPLMRHVGEGWETKSLTIAQEHFASHLVRNLIGSMMRLRPPGGVETILFVTPPEESHELGVLFAACLASLHGFRSIILGAEVPAQEVVRCARRVAPKRVVVGLVRDPDAPQTCAYLNEIARGVPHAVLCCGGEAALNLPLDRLPAGIELVGTLTDFAARLGRAA